MTDDGQEYKYDKTIRKIFIQKEYVSFVYKLKGNESFEQIEQKLRCGNFQFMMKDLKSEKFSSSNFNWSDDNIYLTGNFNINNNDTLVLTEKFTHIIFLNDFNKNEYSNYIQLVDDFVDNTIMFFIWNKTWIKDDKHYLLDDIINIWINL